MSRQSTTTKTDWPLVSVIVMSRESTSTKTDWPPVNITATFRESTTTNTDWPLVNTTVTSRESTTTKTKWPLVNVIAMSRERPPVSVTVMSGESTTEKPKPAPPHLSFSHSRLWNSSNVCLTDDGLLSSFQGRSLSSSPFYVSLYQAVSGVMSLALCPQVVYPVLQHLFQEVALSCTNSP